MGRGRVHAWFAGSRPAGMVHLQSLKLLEDLRDDTCTARSKIWDEFSALDEPDWNAGFRTAYEQLHARASALLDLPFETMDRSALQVALNQIGSEH